MGALAAQKEEFDNFFAQAEQKFFDLINVLESRHTSEMKFSDLEKLIETDGRELLRLLLQAHVDSRGTGDIGESVTGSDGIIRTHRRIGEKKSRSGGYLLRLSS